MWQRTCFLILTMVFFAVRVSADAEVTYFQCKYKINEDSYWVPCFRVHSVATVQSWDAVFPLGVETAVIRVIASSDSMTLLRTNSDLTEFAHRTDAVDFIRRVLRYKGNLSKF